MEQDDKKQIEIPEVVAVSDFAQRLGLGVAQVVGELMKNGVMATVNENIDFDTASIIAGELGFDIIPEPKEAEARPSQSLEQTEEKSDEEVRPPIVAVMGHVDHGKTSLLDAIRESDVASSEAGGITQHIGAYQVTKNDRRITFLDTPGHEAFSAIRAHGARMTDVAIIVVAGDDGVKPQTKEAINHAKDAGVAIVVAINKMDKADADVNRVKQELSEIGILADDWGGDVPCVEVSAKTHDGITKLLDVVLLVADIADQKAIFTGAASGVVIESHLETGRGPVVTLLIQKGTLRTGDSLVVGTTYGKVRSLEDYRGRKLKEATPAMPVVVSGIREVPNFGEWFEVVSSEKVAKDWVAKQARKQSIKSLTNTKTVTSQDLNRAVVDGQVKELAVLVKADVQGSLESLIDSLNQIGNEEVRVKVVSSGVGDISESDVNAADAGNAIILGFNVSIKAAVNQLAKRSKVDFHLYKVIYELLDDIRDWLSSLLPPEIIEIELARLEILGIFKTTKTQIITGGRVTSGQLQSGMTARILRKGEEVGAGKVSNLQKEKQIAREANEGDECGISLDTTDALELGDELVFYRIEEKARKL
jgi:translation initiation factor IF-2